MVVKLLFLIDDKYKKAIISLRFNRYSTGPEMIHGANLIHEFYTSEARNPVYVLVDTSLKTDSSFQVKAYVG